MAEPIEFLATLSGSAAIKFDSEGGGKVLLEVDDTHTAPLVKLLAMRGRIIKVTCEPWYGGDQGESP
jgi:hypothetical protein